MSRQATVDPDFSREVVDDLYRHRPRQLWIAGLLAVSLGLLGAHRVYCGKSLTAVLMLLTVGGGLIWWVWDLFHLGRMVRNFNAEERRRQAEGLPPQGMGFLPPRDQLKLDTPPAWAPRRSGRGRIIGSAALLAVIGISLGTISGTTQAYEPVLVLTLFIAISLVAARWKAMAHLPVLNALVRWVHRLRLYYHTVDPGSLWSLATRPILGLFFAPWRPKARAEVRLHLQLGVALSLLFAVMDAVEMSRSGGFWSGLGLLFGEFLQTLVYTYLFVAPAGALLTTQLLLARRDLVVWVLSAITLAAIYLGFSIVGS